MNYTNNRENTFGDEFRFNEYYSDDLIKKQQKDCLLKQEAKLRGGFGILGQAASSG